MQEQEWDWKKIISALLPWYAIHARDLPWRKTKNPYHIWLSEIMLQQTRVEAVKPYYKRFLETLPTVEALASAEEDTILKLWEGLGYYSRVRNMQIAAKQVQEQYHGELPKDYSSLKGLKGIGSYTAGAIASFAFNLPYAAVDGNVLRVMSRLTGDERDISLASTKKAWEEEITENLTAEIAGPLNQSLMEVGATVCIPNGQPKCEICPLQCFCYGRKMNLTLRLPIRAERKMRKKQKISVFFMIKDNQVALAKRDEKGVLQGMWQLPNAPLENNFSVLFQEWGILQADISRLPERKHIFTHIEWEMDCYFVTVRKEKNCPFVWETREIAEEKYALPSAFKKVWADGWKVWKEKNIENL